MTKTVFHHAQMFDHLDVAAATKETQRILNEQLELNPHYRGLHATYRIERFADRQFMELKIIDRSQTTYLLPLAHLAFFVAVLVTIAFLTF